MKNETFYTKAVIRKNKVVLESASPISRVKFIGVGRPTRRWRTARNRTVVAYIWRGMCLLGVDGKGRKTVLLNYLLNRCQSDKFIGGT